MVYNQEIVRKNRMNVSKSLKVSEQNKFILINSMNIVKIIGIIKIIYAIKKAFTNRIKNNRITKKSWVQC